MMSTPLVRLFLRRLAALRWPRPVAIGFCGVLGTLLPAAVGLVTGIPEPAVHDEFSYLLSADTFAHGRLTNPAPALPEFFEAPHVLIAPTYSSKYPPGQGLALAFGQLVGGHPIWGVWLSCGLFAASLCWMLQAWISRQWALATTVFAIATLGVFSYWAQSYCGGMVAACGGTLLFGAMRRTLRSPRALTSVLCGVGVLLLANTRPYEGLLACIPVSAALGWWFIQDRRTPQRTKITSWMLPFGSVLLIGGAAMVTYNRAVTGDWLLMPHILHTRQYFHHGTFLFSSNHEPERTPAARVARFYTFYASTDNVAKGWMAEAAGNLYIRLLATVESPLVAEAWTDRRDVPYRAARDGITLFLLVIVTLLADRWVWFGIGTAFLVVLGGSIVWWWFPHYTAPVVPLLLAAGALTFRRGIRRVDAVHLEKLAPLTIVVMAGFFLSMFIVSSFVLRRDVTMQATASHSRSASTPTVSHFLSRAEVKRKLEQEAGSHLVFVSYDDEYTVHDEWVYNSADWDASRVIFAHDLGDRRNSELIAAYPQRTIWIVRVSRNQTQLDRYSGVREPIRAAVG